MSDGESTRFRATVHYDGAGFAGWQVQPRRPTVQGSLEARLARLFDAPTRVLAAGRTDAGVHATGQEIAFDGPARWTPFELRRSLNALLPQSIWVEALSQAGPEFHPRRLATGRRYEYFLGTEESALSPIRGGRIWQLGRSLDEGALSVAASLLPGERSFEALRKKGQPGSSRCSVELAEWTRSDLGDLRLTIVADRFLHHMVRYLVATMVDVASGRRELDELRGLLGSTAGARPPHPAPAVGLYLTGVRYPEGWNRPPGVPGLHPATRSSSR